MVLDGIRDVGRVLSNGDPTVSAITVGSADCGRGFIVLQRVF